MTLRLGRSTQWVEDALKSDGIRDENWNPDVELQVAESLRLRHAAELRHENDLPKPVIEHPRLPCPLCGAPTRGGHNWFGAHYHEGIRKGKTPYQGPRKEEWECTQDARHYLWQRANEQLQARGFPSKTLAEWEAYDGKQVATANIQRLRSINRRWLDLGDVQEIVQCFPASRHNEIRSIIEHCLQRSQPFPKEIQEVINDHYRTPRCHQ